MRISASEQVQMWLLGLPPETRARVRAALKALAAGRPADVKALRGELEGVLRLGVSSNRIIYEVQPGRVIHLHYANSRDVVYQVFTQLRRLSGD